MVYQPDTLSPKLADQKGPAQVPTKILRRLYLYGAGCGAGDFLVPFARKFRSGQFTGLDQSNGNIDIIRHFCRIKEAKNVDVEIGDINELSTDDSVDVILCASVLHYLNDSQKVLESFARSLTPGGHLILYVPVNYRRRIPCYERIRREIFRKVDYESGKPFRTDLSFEKLAGELAHAGFSVTSHHRLYGPAGQIAYEISSMAILLIQKVPWVLSGLFTVIYFLAIHPFILLLMLIDFLLPGKQGNGLLITASRDQAHYSID